MKNSTIKRAAEAKPAPRTHLTVGNQIFHNGTPVELLCRVACDRDAETWLVRPLFVESSDRNERFLPYDRISYLHTIRTHSWSRAA